MADRLSGIREFVTVVEAGDFAAAGLRLGLSRSAVGKTVARLESRLGVRLFHRTTRSVTLTGDGETFYEHCQRALASLRVGESALETGRLAPSGTVRVTVPTAFGRHCVAPVLCEVAGRHEGLVLEITFSDRTMDLFEEGYDLAIRNGNLPDMAGLMSRTLARQRMTVCAAPAYLDRHGIPGDLADLSRHRAIEYAKPSFGRQWLFRGAAGEAVGVAVQSRIRLDDLEAIADAAAAGMGIAWLPCWLVRARVAAGDLVRVLDDVPAVEFNSSALWPKGPAMPSRLRVLIDALAARLPSMVA